MEFLSNKNSKYNLKNESSYTVLMHVFLGFALLVFLVTLSLSHFVILNASVTVTTLLFSLSFRGAFIHLVHFTVT